MLHARMVATGRGGPEVLDMIEEQAPDPGPGEARVRVLAAGVAFGDIMWQTGRIPGGPKPPFTPGYDITGTVDLIGAGVSGLELGQRVTGLINYGGYAQYVCAPSEMLVPAPEALDPFESACLPLNYLTAYQLFQRVGHLETGQRVLVHGAAGGLGTAALDVGRALGLELYGTASVGKHDLVRSLAATPIDYRSEDFVARIAALTTEGVDFVIDHIGGAHLSRSFSTLRPGGQLIATSAYASARGDMSAGQTLLGMVRLPLWNLAPNRRAARFFDIVAFNRKRRNRYREDLTALLGLLHDGTIKPVIADRLPLAQAQRAQALVLSAQARGKVLLTPNLSA